MNVQWTESDVGCHSFD